MSARFTYPQIDLDRRFLPIDEVDPEDEPARALLLAAEGKEPGLAWSELLTYDVVVILGEAGSGKTAEFRQQAAKLRTEGTSALVARIESLPNGVDASFDFGDPGGDASHWEWRRRRGKAVFFLDALDEARLPEGRNNAGLSDALNRLVNDIGDRGREVRLVISSRGSEWRGKVDQDIVAAASSRLRNPRRRESNAPAPRIGVFRIAPLDYKRVAAIAVSRGADPEVFLEAVNEAQAADLVRQPLEAHFLLDIWLEDQAAGHSTTFRSRTDVFERVVDFRLQDFTDDERRVVVPLDRLRAGAEQLAAATLLTGVRDIRVGPGPSDELDAMRLLGGASGGWTESEVRQLLATALFQPAVGARIRFAHRELQDFLAARFFDQLMKTLGGGLEQASQLFAEGMGRRFVPDDTAKALGWLAVMNAEARREIQSVAPSLLITAGDPKSLSIEDRAAALRTHVASYDDRRYRGDWFFMRDVERFASPHLAPAVAELLDETASPEARILLVDLARLGRMTGLKTHLARIAADTQEDTRVRAGAADGVALFGSDEDRRAVIAAAREEPPPDDSDAAVARNELILAALSAAYPKVCNLEDARALVATLEREPANRSTMNGDRLASIVADSSERDAWLSVLLSLGADFEQLDDHDLPTVVDRYRVAAPAIAVVATHLLNEGAQYSPALRQTIEYLTRIGEDLGFYRHGDAHKEFRQALTKRSDVKVALFYGACRARRRRACASRLESCWALED